MLAAIALMTIAGTALAQDADDVHEFDELVPRG